MQRVLVLALLLAGCSLQAPPRGVPLGDGSISSALFEVRARSTDVLPVDVFFPSAPDGSPRGSALPALVFIQGGLVDASGYHWLAEELARQGFVVALPHHETRLAILSIDDGDYARQLLVEGPAQSLLEGLVDPDAIAVAGHSLGGVVATKLALRSGYAALALLASLPDSADASAVPQLGMPSLSLAAAQDCSAELAEVRPGWEQLPAPTALAIVEGATHYQFTDDQGPDVKKDCPPEATLEDSHRRIAAALGGFLADALTTGGVGEPALRAIDGVTVEVR